VLRYGVTVYVDAGAGATTGSCFGFGPKSDASVPWYGDDVDDEPL
jgi:hypothetical protein